MNFKNLESFLQCNILKMRKKIHHEQSFNCLVFFLSDRPVCNHLNVNFIKTTLKTIFFLQKVHFCIFNPKTFEVKENCSKTLLNVCPLKCTYIGKNHFNFISVWSEIMSLKSDQLELGFSIHVIKLLRPAVYWLHDQVNLKFTCLTSWINMYVLSCQPRVTVLTMLLGT